MKCAVLTPNRYGIREVAERVGRAWEEAGHDVEFILARGEAARIGPLTVGMPGIALWWYRRLGELADRRDEFDLVWTHQPVAPRLPTRDPDFWMNVVVTFHTTLHREYELARDGIYPRHLQPYYWLVETLESRFYRQLQGLDGSGPQYTVISPHLTAETEAFGIDPEATTHIPNGLFTPDRAEYRPIRGDYGIPDDATLVFNVGSLTAQKRPVEFARVMHAVTAEHDDIYCVVAGKGPLGDRVRELASERLLAPGYISDEEKWRWFSDADVFGSLAAYEGMPVATLEALAFGVPVFLSDIPAHRNVVDRHETTGQLVEPRPEDVERAIRALAGQSATVSVPDWRDIAASYLALAGGDNDAAASPPTRRND